MFGRNSMRCMSWINKDIRVHRILRLVRDRQFSVDRRHFQHLSTSFGTSFHLSCPDKVGKYSGRQQIKFAFIPTKQIVSDDKASGKSMSPAASTSEFGHESFTKIMEVLRVAICREERIRSAWKETIKKHCKWLFSHVHLLIVRWIILRLRFWGLQPCCRKGFIGENWKGFEVFGTSIDDGWQIQPSKVFGVLQTFSIMTSYYSGNVHAWRLKVWLSVVL